MIVRDFYLVSVPVLEDEADPVLVIDAYRPLTFPVTTKLVEPVAGRNPHLLHIAYLIKLRQLTKRPYSTMGWASIQRLVMV